jgi:hypothetical protein
MPRRPAAALPCLLASVFPLATCSQPAPTRPGESPSASVTIPIVTGRPGSQPFAGHPGWIDLHAPGESSGVSARVGRDARFDLAKPAQPSALILTLDRLEIPAVIAPGWNGGDVALDPEYACVPPGYPDVWDRDYPVRAHEHWQTFVARSRHLYALMAFDGPKVVWWGNKIGASVHRGAPGGPRIDFPVPWGTGPDDNPNSHHTDHGFPHVGWRHGDIPVKPGAKYALKIYGYKSHGGDRYELTLYQRPDAGDGYGPGNSHRNGAPGGGDLCLLLFGSLNGQYIENQVRSPEWENLIIKRPPVKRWGQTFIAHGVSFAGVRFWGSNGSAKPASCRILIREDGPDGRPVGPAKTAVSHDTSPDPAVRLTPEEAAQGRKLEGLGMPYIRYPNTPGPLPGHDAFYAQPYDLFQAAWVPDEAPLERGRTYYIDLTADQPLMMFGDGDAYRKGFGYYDGQKIEQEAGLMHDDKRWTLLADIVTYAYPGGITEAEAAAKAVRPHPGPFDPAQGKPDGNLLVNPGAEEGDFAGWTVLGDPVIDPSTHIPDPPNRTGGHRFGMSVGWATAEMGHDQEVPGIEPGATYEAGMWVSHQDGTDEEAELLVVDGGSETAVGAHGGAPLLRVATRPGAEPAWTELKGTFMPTQRTVTLIVRYRHTKPSNVASVHIDDIWLKRLK